MTTSTFPKILVLFLLIGIGQAGSEAMAADPSGLTPNSSMNGGYNNQYQQSDKVDVKALREKYWAKGEENELRVVRNRTYSKEGKVELGVFGGLTATNPFISVKNLGLTLGYHFNEYLGVEALYIRDFVTQSAAQTTFQQTTILNGAPYTADSNYPSYFLGGDVIFSPIYGKLSLLGKSIIYYDLHLLGGAGETATESGTDFTPLVGIGQQIWLAKSVSLRLDYRLTYYHETVLHKTPDALFLTPVGDNNNFSNVVTLGITYLFGI